MKLNDHFKQFIANISLNPSRISRIDSAINNWENKFREDEEIKEKFVDYYTQGSYSTNTGVRPQNKEEFDVDVVLTLEIDESYDPKSTLHWLKDRIKNHKEFEDRVKAKDRCVTIEYAKEFYVDIVPSFDYGNYIKIPSKKEGEWTKTNPVGFKNWCNDINKSSDYCFSKTVKVLKHWRDENVGKDTAPKSILLTTLVGDAYQTKASMAETLVETLETMSGNINNLVLNLAEDDDVPFVRNPSLQEENLARNWTKLKAQRFLRKINSLKGDCREALEEKDKDESIKLWQNIFGSLYFPKELSKAKDMANSIQSGVVSVNSTGELNFVKGTKIKKHRFYGSFSNE